MIGHTNEPSSDELSTSEHAPLRHSPLRDMSKSSGTLVVRHGLQRVLLKRSALIDVSATTDSSSTPTQILDTLKTELVHLCSLLKVNDDVRLRSPLLFASSSLFFLLTVGVFVFFVLFCFAAVTNSRSGTRG